MRVAAGEPPVAPVPATTQHAKGISMDEVFEQRWRKAYEVRALERESRQGQSQVSSRSSSADASSDTAAKPQYGHAVGTVDLQAAAGGAAADALVSRLSLHSAGTAEDGAEASAGGVPAEVQRGRPQEISDDDEEEDGPQSERAVGSAVATEAAAAAVHPAQQRTEGVFEREEEEEEEEEEGEECRVVWDSSQQRQGAASAPPLAAGEAEAAGGADARALKERGNTCLKAGDNEGALLLYSQALEACRAHLAQARQGQKPAAGAEQGTAPHAGHEALASAGRRLLATLHSNRAHALLRLRRGEEAAVEAEQAHQLHPTWPKPLYRLAQAHLALGRWAAAVAACRAGEALARRSADGSTEFTPLMDDIAVAAARAGSTAGYDGDQLEVRYAGPEAWLCRPAPHVPELDGQEDTDGQGVVTHLPPRSHGGALARGGSAPASALAAPGTAAGAGAAAAVGGGDPLVAWSYGRSVAAARGPRRTSFRSIKEAVEAARDGDRIVLRRGQHNGMGETVTLSKRLLIEGEGQPGETFIDQRANNPTFRILRGGVVLRNVVIDQSGFREALLVSGPPGSRPAPLIDGCVVKCSGDDAVNVAGGAAPTFLRCQFESKKCGVKAFGSSAPRFERCAFAKCGEQGLRAQEAAEPVLLGCAVSECGEEAVVGCDAARLTLTACELSQCKGPALDLSGGAAAAVQGSSFHGCVGGVFLWDAASASLKETQVEGGKAHVILADGASTVIVRGSTLRGTVHAADAAWQGILHPSNRLLDPELPADFPRDQGPFRFTPDPYKRKQ